MSVWTRLWTAFKSLFVTPRLVHSHALPPAIKSPSLYVLKEGSDLRIPVKPPDALVEMGREVAASLLSHPERYVQAVFGNQVLVVDDASYEALFYLFSGRTRTKLWDEAQTTAALFLGRHCVMSEQIFRKANGLWS